MKRSRIKFARLFAVLSLFIAYIYLRPTTYGSDTAVSIVNPMNIPTSSDNIIKTFGCAKNGFGFQDLNTSCSFQSIFPVAGPINLRGGKLYLLSDLTLGNTAALLDLGTIKGANHVVDLSERSQAFAYGTNPTGARALALVARATEVANPNSVDWSYDNRYLAVVNANVSGNELQIYSFNGTTLTKLTGVNLSDSGNSVRWHPGSYYLAVASDRSVSKIRLYLYNSTTNTLSLRSTKNPSGSAFRTVCWQARGKYLAVGGSAIYAFIFDSGTGTLTTQLTPTNNAVLNGAVNYDIMAWAPTGNKDDLIAGTDGGSLHLYNCTGSALNHVKRYDYGTAITTLDWAKTSTYMAVGFSNGDIKTYQHTAATDMIVYKNVCPSTASTRTQAVNFNPTASELIACYDPYAGDEFVLYGFNTSTYALTRRYAIDVSSGCWAERYSNGAATYIARVDHTTRYVSVYKELNNPFIFENVKIFLNSGITLGSALTFSGDCAINGRGNKITLTGDGTINIAQGSSLEIKLTDLDLRSPNAFALQGRKSNLKFRKSNIYLNSDVIVGDGVIDVYEDLTVTGPHQFLYSSSYTSTIHSNSVLNFENGAQLKIGKTRETTIEPIYFENSSSQLNFNNATLHTTNSGLGIKKGTVNIFGNSTFNVDWTDTHVSSTSQGLVFGDGVDIYNSPFLIIQGNGTILNLQNGGIVMECAHTTSAVQFYGQSQLGIKTTSTLYLKNSIDLSNGWIVSDTTANLVIAPNSYLTLANTILSPSDFSAEQILTGTVVNTYTTMLDTNDTCNLVYGTVPQIMVINKGGNTITGNGKIYGSLSFLSNESQLTWNSQQILNLGNIDLNGGLINFTQDSGMASNYSFIGSGSVDLMGTTFNLGHQSSDWPGNIYWIGDGGRLRFNSELSLSGIWTFSGSVVVDGNGYTLDLGDTGTIILERGASVEFVNVSLYGMSRQNRIVCKDNNCRVVLNYSDFVLKDDYLFDTGSLFIYYDSDFITQDDITDRIITFTYASTQTSTVDAACKFRIADNVRFSIGRQDSSITDPSRQPLVFNDPVTALLDMDGGTLHVTSSGMILTAGTLHVVSSSKLEIENTVYPYGLILGDGIADNDVDLRIEAGTQLTLKSGRIFYNNNKSSDGIIFGSQESALAVESTSGLYAKRNMALSRGTISMPSVNSVVTGKDPGVFITYTNMHRYDYDHIVDFYLTGTAQFLPVPTSILDSNDVLLINPGTYNRDILVVGGGNKITGIGGISGDIMFTDENTTLSWDLNQPYTASDIDLKGGRIIYTQDAGIGPQYSFKGSGTIDLTTKTLALGTESTAWVGNFYWIGEGGIIRMNNDVQLDGTWTISGSVTIEGNGYSMDLGTTGTIILERGAQLTFNNFALYNMTRQNGIICRDNNCQLTLNYVDLILAGDYLFDTGSIYVYFDSIIMPVSPDLDSIFTFSYATTQPCLIDSDASLAIWPGVRFSTGRPDSTITDVDLQPLIFADPSTSRLIMNGGTLHTTSSGMIMTKGKIDVSNSSNLEIDNTAYPYGMILGDGTAVNDFELELEAGNKFKLKSGRLFYNNYANNRIVFDSPESNLAIEPYRGVYAKTNLTLTQGTVSSPTPTDIVLGWDPGIDVIGNNMHRYDYSHINDFYVTGTLNPPIIILDSNDQILINPGVFNRTINIIGGGNKITGIGTISGAINFTDYHTTLSWDIPEKYHGGNIDLKGGRIIYTQDSGLIDGYTFKSSGTIDISRHIFELGLDDTIWSGNFYWVGQDSILVLNNNVTIDGTWTISGNMTIEGNNYLIDLAPTGSIILERGATINFKDMSIYNMSRQNRITCLGDDSQIILNVADLLMAGDYLWDKGSIYTYYNSNIGLIDGLDGLYTFSYQTTEPATIDSYAFLKIKKGARLSMGRLDSGLTGLDQQPLIFNDPITSKLFMDGGVLHVTSSGMILAKGILEVSNSSVIEIENTAYPYGLILGDATADNDFEINIDAGCLLTVNYGSIFYNNYLPTRVVFGSPASSLEVKNNNGFHAKRNLRLSNGSLYTSGNATVAIAKDNGVAVIQDNILRYYNSLPYISVQKHNVHDISPYILEDGDYFYVTEGYSTNDVIAQSGSSNFGGPGGFGGTLTLENNAVTVRSALLTQFFCDVALNGGTFVLASDNFFAGDNTFTGSGTVQMNGTRLLLGTLDVNLTHSIYWQGLTSGSIELGARTSLSGTWTIDGTIEVNGNGNVLDFANHGVLTIQPNSTLILDDVHIKGLGAGASSIKFMADSSVLKLSNVNIELDNNMNTTIGGVYVDGSTVIGVKDFDWLFDQKASLTVDGVTLWLDPLDKINHGNIKFGSGSIGKYLTLTSSGTIKTMANLDTLSSGTTLLQDQITNNSNSINYLSDHFISVNDGTIYAIGGINGTTEFAGRGFVSSPIDLNGGTLTLSSDLILSNKSTIESSGKFNLLGNAVVLGGNLVIPNNVNIIITSDGVLDGQGNNLDLSTNSKLIVDTDVTLTLRNLNLVGPGMYPIEMRSNTSRLALQDVIVSFDNDFTFTQGQLFVEGDVMITGSNKFSYASTATSYVASHATLCFDKHTTFSYSPNITGRHTLSERNLIKLADKTSSVFFDECTLQLPDSGMQVTKGSIYFNNKVILNGRPTITESFEWGDGTLAGEVDVNVLSGAFLETNGYIYHHPAN